MDITELQSLGKNSAIRFGQVGGALLGFMLHIAKDLTIDSTGGSGSNNRHLLQHSGKKEVLYGLQGTGGAFL
jgi:hypothetical protein